MSLNIKRYNIEDLVIESIEINITKYLIEELNYCRHVKSVQELTLSRWELEGKKKTLS